MLTLVFVFMLFNLTSIWNLPTISIGVHGHDGVPSLVHPGAQFFIHVHARKAAPRGIPRWRQPPAIPCQAASVSSVKVICLLNQIALPLIIYGLEVGLHCAVLPPWWHHPKSWDFTRVVPESHPIIACRHRACLSLHNPLVLKWANHQKSVNPQTM